MAGELGKASLDLEANLRTFEKNMAEGKATTQGLGRDLDALTAIANVAEKALNDVGMSPRKAAESRISASQILDGVKHISDASRMAALELDRVHLDDTQAAETEVVGGVIEHVLDKIRDKALEARAALGRVNLPGRNGVEGRSGVGVGPFGSGYGRLGVLGTAIGLGVATAPSAAPAALGLLAGVPTLAMAAAGALGVLALAADGVAKAIGGDKKAFEDLSPAAQKFVLTVRSLDGLFDRMRGAASASLFPGLTKGLQSALSPGTVNALFTGIVQLGRALGGVGAEFGRYFGSAEFQKIFGPLMQSAARNIGVLGDALLHLFDAFGVLGRAAIPFVNWLNSMIDKGSKLADSWIHAQDASGALAHAMDAARTSLTLLGRLAGSLINVVIALGRVLYPIGNVVLKDLTAGLNALAGIIDHNQSVIQGIVGGALRAFVDIVKLAATGVGVLWHALQSILGHKGTIIAGITAIGVAITMALGPEGAAIAGALVAIGLVEKRWGAIAGFFRALGTEIVNAFKYVWYLIEKGALLAALKVVEPFSHLPGFLGGWARKAKNAMQTQLDKLHPPNMAWPNQAAKDGAITGAAWAAAFKAQTAKNQKQIQSNVLNMPPLPEDIWLRQHPGATHKQYEAYVQSVKLGEQIAKADQKRRSRHHHGNDPAPGTHAWYMKYLGYDPTQQPTYGTPPPFTKNTGTGGSGSKSVIPVAVAQLEAEASRQDQAASALHYAGAKARKHLETEITDLEKADSLLAAKIKQTTGRKKTELENAVTANLRKITEARKRLGDALTKGRQSALNFALDQAKLAVENAKQGSKAWDTAIKAEETALNAEIRYWDKRAHNDKLSRDVRDAALRKEISYEKQLHALLTQRNQAVAANEAQFLQSFVEIENTFAPNAVPYQVPTGSGKTDTHLHDIKQAARETAGHLKAIRSRARFPGSGAGMDAAMAVNG